MNTKIKVIGLLMFSVLGSTAFAKAPLQVDFNQLIDEGVHDRAELNQAAAAPTLERADVVTKERRKVIDFIDMEISVGAERNVVERD